MLLGRTVEFFSSLNLSWSSIFKSIQGKIFSHLVPSFMVFMIKAERSERIILGSNLCVLSPHIKCSPHCTLDSE